VTDPSRKQQQRRRGRIAGHVPAEQPVIFSGIRNKKVSLVERLFADHGSSLQAFLFRRVRRQPIAAELAQEVYVRMLRVPDMGAVRNPEAYLAA
jgi:hypothetical protein